jgi:membrane peptidoglycan carboxypeptidase
MRRRDHNIFANGSSLLICGLLAGVVVAAAAFPAVAMAGLAAKAGGQTFAELPSELRQMSAPQISRIFASDNKTQMAVMYDEFRSNVPLRDISVNMQNAIIAAEDREFYHHNGVDLKGVARAFVNNNQGGEKQGASTLTMQYVRMSIAYSATNPQEVVDATQDTPKRKITEMKYALQVEKELSKQQILERYLNIAPFGNQTYGVFAASQVYFGKRPKDLTIPEAALLAGMVKAPTSFNPTTANGYPQAVARRHYVINAMVTTGAITAAQAAEADKVPIPHTVRPMRRDCVNVAKNSWGFYCDVVYRWWLSQPAFGATAYDRERRLKTGGYRIVTAMDVNGQNAARARILEQTSDDDRNALMIAGVEPGTGLIRVLAANRKFKLDDRSHPQNPLSSDPELAARGVHATYPNTTNPILSGGGDIAGYQAGSVFKIFTMVAALEKGYPLGYTINAPDRYRSHFVVEFNSPGACPGTHFYCPGNAAPGEAGVYNMWTGFGASINTYFVPLEERVGAANVIDVAKRFGVQFRAGQDAYYADHGDQWGAFTLGVSASTPLDMAAAYATLAGDGKYCTPTPIQSIKTQDGESLDVGKPHCTQATTPDVARAALDAARCPVGDSAQLGSCGGHRTAGQAYSEIGHPIYGKTGTTDADKTAALIVGTTSLVVAGYLANPDYADHPDHMSHHIVNPAVWNTMKDFMDGKPKEQFKKPDSDKMAFGDQRRIPWVHCDSVESAVSQLRDAGFEPSVESVKVDSDCPADTAAGTNPSGRTIKGGVVVVEVSNGRGHEPPVQPAPTQTTGKRTPPIIIFPPGPRPPRR